MRIYRFKWHTNQYTVDQQAAKNKNRPVTEITFDFHRDEVYPILGNTITQANWAAASLAKGYAGAVHYVRPAWFGEEIRRAGQPLVQHVVLNGLPRLDGPLTGSLCFDYVSHSGTYQEQRKLAAHRPDAAEIRTSLSAIIDWITAYKANLESFSLVESPDHVFPDHIPLIAGIFLELLKSSNIDYALTSWENDRPVLPPLQLCGAQRAALPAFFY